MMLTLVIKCNDSVSCIQHEVFGTCKAHDNSSVDSIDGVCASRTDEDNVSVSSEFETIPTESLKPQKLEMRIGINHFNRLVFKMISLFNFTYFICLF